MTKIRPDAPSRTLPVHAVHVNLDQEVIEITQDKLELIIHKHAQNLGRQRIWVGPAGVVLSIVLTLVTSDFKLTVGVEPGQWRAVFVVALGAAFLWTLRNVYLGWRSPTVEQVLDLIKKTQLSPEQPASLPPLVPGSVGAPAQLGIPFMDVTTPGEFARRIMAWMRAKGEVIVAIGEHGEPSELSGQSGPVKEAGESPPRVVFIDELNNRHEVDLLVATGVTARCGNAGISLKRT